MGQKSFIHFEMFIFIILHIIRVYRCVGNVQWVYETGNSRIQFLFSRMLSCLLETLWQCCSFLISYLYSKDNILQVVIVLRSLLLFFFLLSHHSVLVLYKEYKCIHIKSFTEPEDWVKCSLFQLVQVNVCGPFHLIPETREFQNWEHSRNTRRFPNQEHSRRVFQNQEYSVNEYYRTGNIPKTRGFQKKEHSRILSLWNFILS